MQFDPSTRRELITLLGGAVVAWSFAARAHQPTKRRIGIVAVPFWMLTILAMQAQTRPLSLETAVEEMIHPEFNEAVRKFWLQVRPASDLEKKLAMDEIKTLFYNRAYAQYFCVKSELAAAEAARRKADESKIVTCITDRMKHEMTTTKIMNDYSSIVARNSMRCEMQARLFKAESEFPPFAFLKGDHVSLFDYEKLNDCYLANVQ